MFESISGRKASASQWHRIWVYAPEGSELKATSELEMVKSAQTVNAWFEIYKDSADGSKLRALAFRELSKCQGEFDEWYMVCLRSKGSNDDELYALYMERMSGLADESFDCCLKVHDNAKNDDFAKSSLRKMNDVADTFKRCSVVRFKAVVESDIWCESLQKMRNFDDVVFDDWYEAVCSAPGDKGLRRVAMPTMFKLINTFERCVKFCSKFQDDPIYGPLGLDMIKSWDNTSFDDWHKVWCSADSGSDLRALALSKMSKLAVGWEQLRVVWYNSVSAPKIRASAFEQISKLEMAFMEWTKAFNTTPRWSALRELIIAKMSDLAKLFDEQLMVYCKAAVGSIYRKKACNAIMSGPKLTFDQCIDILRCTASEGELASFALRELSSMRMTFEIWLKMSDETPNGSLCNEFLDLIKLKLFESISVFDQAFEVWKRKRYQCDELYVMMAKLIKTDEDWSAFVDIRR